MSDQNNDAETPMQRALRMKKAAAASKPAPPRGKHQPRDAAGMTAGASKPAMRK